MAIENGPCTQLLSIGGGTPLYLPGLTANCVVAFVEDPQDLAALQGTCIELRAADASSAYAAHCRAQFPTLAGKLDEAGEVVNWKDIFSRRKLKQREWDNKKSENSSAAKAAAAAAREASKAAALAAKQKEKGYRAKCGGSNRKGNR
eukprot:TRINITY_DN10771_c0_g1_i1.p2 TRINITY_DN10771_c0_g1~~TRINITY_DN10771_c0_g1_i1.p2  ORF type:complete len:147 (+),score=43.55 TRINITY_DN10771_c0_g1_i1:76-516(+)